MVPLVNPIVLRSKGSRQPLPSIFVFFFSSFRLPPLSLSITFSQIIRVLPRRTRGRRFMPTVISRLVLSFPRSLRLRTRTWSRPFLQRLSRGPKSDRYVAARRWLHVCVCDNAPPPPLCFVRILSVINGDSPPMRERLPRRSIFILLRILRRMLSD